MVDFFKAVNGDEPNELINPFDMKPARDILAEIDKGLTKIENTVNAFEVKTDEDASQITEMMAQARGVQKQLGEKKKVLVADAYGFYKAVGNLFRPADQRLGKIVNVAKSKFGEYHTKKELERRKAQKKAQEEHEKKQKALLDAAEKSGVSKKGLALDKPVFKRKQEPTRTQSGSASVKMALTFEIMDLKKVPSDYLIVDENAIKAAIKGGLVDREWWLSRGVRLYEKAKVSVRT